MFSGPAKPQPGSYGTFKTTLEMRRDAHDILITAYDPILDNMLASRQSIEF